MSLEKYEPLTDPVIIERWTGSGDTWTRVDGKFSYLANTKFKYSIYTKDDGKRVLIIQPAFGSLTVTVYAKKTPRFILAGDDIRVRIGPAGVYKVFDGKVSEVTTNATAGSPKNRYDIQCQLISDAVLALTQKYTWTGELPAETAKQRLMRLDGWQGWTVSV